MVMAVDQIDQEMKRALLAATILLLYAVPLLWLGIVWWKALFIGLMFTVAFVVGFSRPWISHGGVALLALGAVVWIEALPPTAQWKPAAKAMMLALKN